MTSLRTRMLQHTCADAEPSFRDRQDKLIEPFIVAREGQVVTCENGHEIAVMARNVTRMMLRGPPQPSWFRDWKIARPIPGQLIEHSRCETCGLAYIQHGRNNDEINIGAEWKG